MAHGRSPRHRRKRPVAPDSRQTPDLVRIQKILSAAGLASRRGAEEFIRAGRVTVNGRTAHLGESADPETDEVAFDGESVRSGRPRYWMLHKPKGVVTTVADPHGRRTVVDLLPDGLGRLYPVGRLDSDSTGLVLLTNDGALTQRLLHPSYRSEKEYRVTVRGEFGKSQEAKVLRGIHLEDGRTAPAQVREFRFDPERGQSTLVLTLHEGRKRQIRRMMLALGCPVKKLVRIRIGPLWMGRLAPGLSRPLRADEVRSLKAYAAQSRERSRRGRSG
jgi:pseudouridine synthase